MKRIAIIGAGCSGLTAIKCCLDEGLEPVCFERENDIGGLWNYTDTAKVGKGSVYSSCVINTSKEMMAFSDFPPPAEFPMFMPHQYVLKYFRMYADNFDLLKHIQFKTSVKHIRPAPDYEQTGRWQITYSNEQSKTETSTDTFDGVLVCSGHHTVPYMPSFAGLEKFKGTTIHSHSYRDSKQYAGKRVLVVGIGNSAVDIAVDLSHVASEVLLSTRRGAWVISRMGFWGLPADAMANSRFLFSLPQSALQWSVEKMANFRFDHNAYGLKPAHRPLEAHPTINDELPYKIMTGKVKIRPNVCEFSEEGVEFDDGTREQIDDVIFATGYSYKIPFVDKSITEIQKNETCLYKYVFPPHLTHPTFAVIGMVQAIGAVMPISEIQSRWFTQVVKGDLQLPSKQTMMDDISAKKEAMSEQYVSSQRHTLQTFWIDYMDSIASEIGVRPDLRRLFWKDPSLALRCLFGPCSPAQYRLVGPGRWNGAKPAIMGTLERCMAPLKSSVLPANKAVSDSAKCTKKSVSKTTIDICFPGFLKSYFILIFVCLVLFCMCLL